MADRLISTKDLGFTAFEIVMCDGDYKKALKMLLDKIDNAPTIKAEPKHGHWEIAIGYDPRKAYQCSNCSLMTFEPTNYCPHCGAKMDERRKDEF